MDEVAPYNSDSFKTPFQRAWPRVESFDYLALEQPPAVFLERAQAVFVTYGESETLAAVSANIAHHIINARHQRLVMDFGEERARSIQQG